MPLWDEIVNELYDKQLDCFSDEVIKVIYSTDKSIRYVILKDESGILSYQLETIYLFEEDEWRPPYPCASWMPYLGKMGSSFFNTLEELIKEIESEPEYKMYF